MAAAKHLGQQLREYRKARGVSQEELASALGLEHKSSISRRERGETAMSRADLLEACAAVERVVENRISNLTPAEVLSET